MPGRLCFSIVLFLLAFTAEGARAQKPPAQADATDASRYILSADSLSAEDQQTLLPHEWAFSPRDDSAFARPEYDDAGWARADVRLLKGEMPDGWDGLGWFRLRFRVDATLQNMPLGLRLVQRGASEVYLDGQLLYRAGAVGTTAATTDAQLQRAYHAFLLSPGRHLLAVRYANHKADAFHASTQTVAAGFVPIVGDMNVQVAERLQRVRLTSIFQFLFVGVFVTLALLHFALFAFNSQAVENAPLALLIGALAVASYLGHQTDLTTSPAFRYLYFPELMRTSLLLIGVFALLFIYQLFYERPPRSSYFVPVAGAVAIALSWTLFEFRVVRLGIFILFLGACIEMLRVVGVALYRQKSGARIVGIGIGVMVLCFGFTVVREFAGYYNVSIYVVDVPFFGALFLAVALSVYLSRGFARTSRQLRRELERVQVLSRQKREQERKLQELEEARRLQHSMLPKEMPDHPDLELAAYLEPAEEVGGDYYDFDRGKDGTLTIAVGDATGHGLKAGTMVTAMKSLFQAFGGETDLPGLFQRSTRALKAMNLHRLYMALTVAKYEGGRLRLCAAGMPPALVYRAGSGQVETIRLKGMPLGSFPDFPYQETTLALEEGDAVLLMSDGFPETFNKQGEMIGYERARAVLADAGGRSSQAIIDRFVEETAAWANGRPQDDDVTFVALKVRG